MKKILLIFFAALMLLPASMTAQNKGKFAVYGIAFYNLENLFDTIPNNPLGRDEEYTPAGKNHWGSKKYWSKIKKNQLVLHVRKSENCRLFP